VPEDCSETCVTPKTKPKAKQSKAKQNMRKKNSVKGHHGAGKASAKLYEQK